MSVTEIVVLIFMCIIVAISYTIVGYEFVDIFMNDPKWTLCEKILLCVFWPIIIPLLLIFFVSCIISVTVMTLFIGITVIYNKLKLAFKKLFK